MSVFEHNYRSRIYNPGQHPLRHTLEDFAYTNNAMPNITSLQSAMDWLFTVLYPRTKDAVATPADLPSVGNTLLDYRVVLDDGDGKAASYRWEQREGDVAAKWYKIYDMDWGEGSILSNFLDKTQDVYVYKYGIDDRASDGTALAGVDAGQHIYGGDSASTNLTLHANSGDGTGAQTGYVQTADHFRPTSNNALDLGASSYKFRTGYFATSVLAGTATISGGSYADSSGSVSFGALNLSTTGTLGAHATTVTSLTVDGPTTTTTISDSITNSTGTVSFADNIVSTTGSLTGGQVNVDNLRLDGNTFSSTNTDGDINLYPNGAGMVWLGTQVQASSTVFTAHGHKTFLHADSNFGDLSSANDYSASVFRTYANPTTGSQTGTLNGVQAYAEAGGNKAVTLVVGVDAEAIYSGSNTTTTLYGGRFQTTNSSTGMVTTAASLYCATPTNSGGGTIGTSYAFYADGASYFNGIMTVVTRANVGNLRLDTNTLSSTDTNGDVILSPNGSGKVQTTATLYTGTDATYDLGTTTRRFQNLYISGAIGDGTTTIASSVLQSLRDINVGVDSNYTIFWNGTKWVASAPDSEIDHTTLSNLTSGDAGHTQFALLAGRSGGQTLQGGTAASENLVLESTHHATKGNVLTKDTFAANTDAAFSSVWSGANLGGSSNRFCHVYTAGEHFGFRLENRSSDDTSSAQKIGRLWWNTTSKYIAVDDGASITRVSLFRYSTDTSWDGSTTVKNVTVSGIDATQALWQLKDNTNNYETMYVKIEATSTTNVRITTNVALAAGSYRLIGIQ